MAESPVTPSRVAILAAKAMRWLQELYTAPFRVEAISAASPSLAEREERRRSDLLRLIIFSLFALQQVGGAILFSVLFLTHTFPQANDVPWAAPLAQTILLILSIVCWWLNLRGQTRLASGLYVFGILVLFVAVVHIFSGGISDQSLFLSSFLATFILAAGLLLPSWAIGAATGVLVFGMALNILTDGQIRQELADPSTVRVPAVSFLIFFYVLVAVLTWTFTRSTGAGLETTERALQHERELTMLKDLFIMDANHELRTPIMALYGSVELLHALGNGAPTETWEPVVARALHAGDTVLQFLENVLDASSLEARTMHLRTVPVRLSRCVSDTVAGLDIREIRPDGQQIPMLQSRSVTVKIPPALAVMADEGRLRQVVVNLISNALKYSPAGSPLVIVAMPITPVPTTDAAGKTGASEFVQIGVQDSGLGVPPEAAPYLFQRFVRLERDIAGHARGTGVGLYVCRVLVEAMGGRIWVESPGIPGQGSTFFFTLPKVALDDKEDADQTQPRQKTTEMR